MLLDRLSYWGEEKNSGLYEKMYQNMLDGYCFENKEFNVLKIVDNDIVNYCEVITEKEYPKDFKKLLKLYKKKRTGFHHISKQYQIMKTVF